MSRRASYGCLKSNGLANLCCLILVLNTEQGKSNKAADTLSHHPYVSEEVDSNPDSEEYEAISYTIECEELEEILDGEKIP